MRHWGWPAVLLLFAVLSLSSLAWALAQDDAVVAGAPQPVAKPAALDHGLGVPLVIHFHSKFSDGSHRPKEIADHLVGDVNGVILTDHHFCSKSFTFRLRHRTPERFSEIGTTTKEILGQVQRPGNDVVGYANYLATGIAFSQEGFHFIPGAELGWFDGEDEHHLLLLDISSPELRKRFVENEDSGESGHALGKKLGRTEVESILELCTRLRVPTVAAHPANEKMGYPITEARSIPRLIEFFNNGVVDDAVDRVHLVHRRRAEVEQREVTAYLTGLALKDGVLGVTAGSDFHTTALNRADDKLGGSDQWHRYTYICGVGDRPSRAQLLQGLYNGQTYAAVEDAAVLEISPALGLEVPHPVSSVTLRIKLTARVRTGRQLCLYRVGSDGHTLVNTWTWQGDTITAEHTDATARPGEKYSYVWYVPDQLITSPIRVSVRK